jgi:hypothetical protein
VELVININLLGISIGTWLATITLLHSKFKTKPERLFYFPGSPDEPDLVRSTGPSGSELAVYTTNMATPAMNIATVVIATTVHPKRELGWPCISFLSEATTSIAPRRKGANSPLMTPHLCTDLNGWRKAEGVNPLGPLEIL